MDQTSSAPEFTANALMQFALNRGWPVSEQKIARWISTGLFVGGHRPGRGKGLGRGPRLFPGTAVPHFLRLCELTQGRIGQKQLGWDLWWAGFGVDPKFWWTPLKHAAANWDKTLGVVRPKVGTRRRVDVAVKAHSAIEQIAKGRLDDPSLRQAHRRLKTAKLTTLILTLARVGTGAFDRAVDYSCDEERDDEETDLRKGLGLTELSVNELRWAIGLPPTDYQADEALTWLAKRLKNKSTVKELEQGGVLSAELARDELKGLRQILLEAETGVKLDLGKGGSDLNSLEHHLKSNRKASIMETLIWICIGPDSELRTGAASILNRHQAKFE